MCTMLLFAALPASAQTKRSKSSTDVLKDSVSVLSQKIELNPNSMELRMRKAEINILLEQWTYAMDEYNAILNQRPEHVGALYFRGFVNTKLRRYAFARKDYEKVLMIEPGHKGALTGLILANIEDGRSQDALDLSNTLVEQHPDDAMSYSIRAQAEEVKGMYDWAIDDYDKAIALSSEIVKKEGRIANADDNLVLFVCQKAVLLKKQNKKKDFRRDIDALARLGMPLNAAEKIVSDYLSNR